MEKKKTPQKNNTVFVLFEGRETCREGRDEASFHSLAHSPNVCNIWTRPGVAGGLELLLGLLLGLPCEWQGPAASQGAHC